MMEPIIEILWQFALSGDMGFAAGIAFAVLLILYVGGRIYMATSKFVSDFLELWISKRKRLDDIEVEKENYELDLQRHTLSVLRKTGGFKNDDA